MQFSGDSVHYILSLFCCCCYRFISIERNDNNIVGSLCSCRQPGFRWMILLWWAMVVFYISRYLCHILGSLHDVFYYFNGLHQSHSYTRRANNIIGQFLIKLNWLFFFCCVFVRSFSSSLSNWIRSHFYRIGRALYVFMRCYIDDSEKHSINK